MSREMATTQRGAGAPPEMRPLRGMQAPPTRSLASAPLPDTASRVSRATLRGASHVVGASAARRRRYDLGGATDLSEAER